MWSYQKRLQYPINIKNPNPRLAQMIIAQYGGLYSILLCYLLFIYICTTKKCPPSRRKTAERALLYIFTNAL